MQHDHDRQLADAERIPSFVLPYLLAAHRSGCDAAFDELRRGFAHLVFEVAERITDSLAARLELMAFMYDDLARVLMAWPLEVGALAIGATGFTKEGSRWVGFDFDSITGHAAGICDEELNRVREAAKALPYVEVRRSTSGNGLHLYVMLDCIPTANHTEHSAVARAVLGKMSRDAEFDFKDAVDCVGGNMWFWSRRATPENQGLTLIKASTQELTESDIGAWRFVSAADAAHPAVEEDEDHGRILEACRKHGTGSYDEGTGCYRAHTSILKQVHAELKLKGAFEAVSTGTDLTTPNAFMFPRPHGALYVVRFGTDNEHPLWDRTAKGQACILFNHAVPVDSVCRAVGAIQIRGGFTCPNVAKAKEAARMFGIAFPEITERRINFLFVRGGLTIECDRAGKESHDEWGVKGRRLERFFSIDEPEHDGFDDDVRHLVSSKGEDAGHRQIEFPSRPVNAH